MSNSPERKKFSPKKKPITPRGKKRTMTRQSKFDLPVPIREYLDAQNLAYRWLDRKKLIGNGGFHEYGWSAHVFDNVDEFSKDVLHFSFSPDKTIVRGDLVLASRALDVHQDHQAELAEAAGDHTAEAMMKRDADDLKDRASADNVNISVEEGYDDRKKA